MKANFIIILLCLTVFSCAKKQSATPITNNPAPTATPIKKINVKINSIDFNYDVSSAFKFGISPINRSVIFTNSTTSEEVQIHFSSLPVPASYTITKTGSPYISYVKNNLFYTSVSGNLNITEIDTFTNGVIHKMVGSFNCKTDTVNNTFFEMLNGNINY
jgi:hypothetical protein